MTARTGRAVRVTASIVVGSVALLWCAVAQGQDVSLDGFAQSQVAARTSGVDCPSGTACDFPAAELRAQLQAEGKTSSGDADFLARFDLLHDAAVDDTELVTRELYGDLTSEKVSARLGRQVITWGVGDLLFINDTFPKDWVAFFTGQPMEYLKLGSDALKLDAFPGPLNLELVIAGFRPDNTPTSRRFIIADPLPPGLPLATAEPGTDSGEVEISGKISGYLDDWELAGYVSRTHYRSPAWRVTGNEIVSTYPRLNTVGASLAGPVGKGVVSLEAGYYDSAQNRDGQDPFIRNSQFRGLVGYSRPLWDDATLGLQLYGEWMANYEAYRENLPSGSPVKDQLRTVATGRFTQLFANQTIAFNLFTLVGLREKDVYVIPSLRYAFSDSLWAEIGANQFAGKRNGAFGSMQDNSNVYLTVRYVLPEMQK